MPGVRAVRRHLLPLGLGLVVGLGRQLDRALAVLVEVGRLASAGCARPCRRAGSAGRARPAVARDDHLAALVTGSSRNASPPTTRPRRPRPRARRGDGRAVVGGPGRVGRRRPGAAHQRHSATSARPARGAAVGRRSRCGRPTSCRSAPRRPLVAGRSGSPAGSPASVGRGSSRRPPWPRRRGPSPSGRAGRSRRPRPVPAEQPPRSAAAMSDGQPRRGHGVDRRLLSSSPSSPAGRWRRPRRAPVPSSAGANGRRPRRRLAGHVGGRGGRRGGR